MTEMVVKTGIGGGEGDGGGRRLTEMVEVRVMVGEGDGDGGGHLGIPAGLVFSVPVRFHNGSWSVCSDITISDELRTNLETAIQELTAKPITRSGVRTHEGMCPLDLKSNALTTRPSWYSLTTPVAVLPPHVCYRRTGLHEEQLIPILPDYTLEFL
ncbi:hypothetical protein NFI96_000951 [Prochilodus magdalenae]|nr:hypothetical protein NFI96_000951 [Prochilodus magdalenae]